MVNVCPSLAQVISTIPAEEAKLLLVIGCLSENKQDPVYLSMLATLSGLSLERTNMALKALKERGLIKDVQRMGQKAIALSETYFGKAWMIVGITEDGQEVEQLSRELSETRHAYARQQANVRSDLASVLPGESGEVCAEIEGHYGRPLTPGESCYLGMLFQGYGPDRVRSTFRASIGSRDPLRTTYAKLSKGKSGKAAAPKTPGIMSAKYQEVNL